MHSRTMTIVEGLSELMYTSKTKARRLVSDGAVELYGEVKVVWVFLIQTLSSTKTLNINYELVKNTIE